MLKISWGLGLVLGAGLAVAACGDQSIPVESQQPLHINISGEGRVVSAPEGVDCQQRCDTAFAAGSRVTLRAEAAPGQRFRGWSGDCSGLALCELLLDQARQIVALFEPEIRAAPSGLWLKGDMHVHDDHSSDGSFMRQLGDDRGPGNVSIQDQIGFARFSGLDFLPLTDHRTYDQHYDPTWESPHLLLIPGEEANGSPHATTHGAVDSIVQGASNDDEPRRLQQSVWDAHSQGAIWITAHPDDGMVDGDGQPNARASVVGVDLVETWNRASDVEGEIDYAEHRWNAGFRFGIAGASDSHFRELWLLSGPGLPITQVFAAERNERAILQALSAGRTALTGDGVSPVVTLEADFDGDGVYEAIGGDEVLAPAGTAGTLRIRVKGGMGTAVHLYGAPGRSAGPLQTFRPGLLELDARYEVAIVAPGAPAWYRVEVRGLSLPHAFNTSDLPMSIIPMPQEIPNQLRAMTSPIFVSAAPVDAQPELPLPTDAGTADGALLALGDSKRFSGFPDIAVDGAVTHLVAELHDTAATQVVYRRRSGNGWSAPVLLSPSRYARFPSIAARGQDVWVAWQDESAGQQPRRPAIMTVRSRDGGLHWDAPQTLRAIAGRAERPDIAITADGDAIVVWQEIRAAQPFDVLVQRPGVDAEPQNLSRAGKDFAAANLLDTRSARYPASVWPRVAVAPDGRTTVAWQDNRSDSEPLWTGQTFSGEGTDPDNWQIMLRSRSASSSEWQAAQTLGADDQADRHPVLAYDAQNRLVVAWDSKPLKSSGVDLVVLAASADDSGNFSAPAPIAQGAQGMGQYPRLGRQPDGRVRVVWTDSRSLDWRWRVMTGVFDGAAWQDTRLLPARGNNSWPSTAGGQIVFASTRNAQRMQRDPTQQVFLLPAP